MLVNITPKDSVGPTFYIISCPNCKYNSTVSKKKKTPPICSHCEVSELVYLKYINCGVCGQTLNPIQLDGFCEGCGTAKKPGGFYTNCSGCNTGFLALRQEANGQVWCKKCRAKPAAQRIKKPEFKKGYCYAQCCQGNSMSEMETYWKQKQEQAEKIKKAKEAAMKAVADAQAKAAKQDSLADLVAQKMKAQQMAQKMVNSYQWVTSDAFYTQTVNSPSSPAAPANPVPPSGIFSVQPNCNCPACIQAGGDPGEGG